MEDDRKSDNDIASKLTGQKKLAVGELDKYNTRSAFNVIVFIVLDLELNAAVHV